jgi:hypothetical protein
MKKTLFFTALVLIVALSISMVACAPVEDTPQPDTRYALQEELVLSNDLDYRTVTLNEGKYPILSDQGLFLVTGYDETDFNVALQVPADDEDGIRNHFDPTKPSIIIIHGLQMGVGRYGQVTMSAENREAEVRNKIYNKYVQDGEIEYLQDSRFDKIHDLTKYWYDGGNGGQPYNVFFFHYERFLDCGPSQAVDKIWSRGSNMEAMYFDTATGSYVNTEPHESINGYSVAELYAGEYLRAFGHIDTIYPEYKNSGNRIYTAAHSMGGVLNVAGNILLKQLSEKGEINETLTPSRLIQMDSYISVQTDDSDKTIAWSSKGYAYLKDAEGVEDVDTPSAVENYLCAIEGLALRYNVAIDYYVNNGWVVPFLSMTSFDREAGQWVKTGPIDMSVPANRVLAVTTMVIIKPYFAGISSGIYNAGHNPVREWILSSYLYDAPTVVKDGVTYTVPTARMSNEDVIALRGTLFEMCNRDSEGVPADGTDINVSYKTETVRCDDDMFVKLA